MSISVSPGIVSCDSMDGSLTVVIFHACPVQSSATILQGTPTHLGSTQCAHISFWGAHFKSFIFISFILKVACLIWIIHIFFYHKLLLWIFPLVLTFSLNIVCQNDVSHFHDVQLVITYSMDCAFNVVSKTQHHTQDYLKFSTILFSGRLLILISCGRCRTHYIN